MTGGPLDDKLKAMHGEHRDESALKGAAVQIDSRATVARILMNRPQSRNALSRDMLGALIAALESAVKDTAVKVIVMAGSGPVFSAGHDLKELTAARAAPDGGRAFFEATFAACAELMLAIAHAPKPIIAEVQGLATAAGCQLVAACDLAIAAASARFATPGVNIGLFCTSPGVALGRAIAPKHASEMLLTGEAIDAQTALRIGLINRVVPDQDLTVRSMEWAALIASKPAPTLARGKAAFRAQMALPLDKAYAQASGAMTANLLDLDAQLGIAAFLSKQTPDWSRLEMPAFTHPATDETIHRVLAETKTIALVGASANPERDSHEVMGFLQGAGYRVIPVNPGLAGQTLLGELVYEDLAAIPFAIDMVDVFRRSDALPEIAEAAIAKGARTLWTQLGVVHGEAARAAAAAGLTVIMDRCPKIEIPRLARRG